MLKYITIFSLLFLYTTAGFCQNTDKSEMAQVMVQMLQYIKTEKVRIEKGKHPVSIPSQFNSITNAKPTHGKALLDNHIQLSDNFLQLLNKYKVETNTNKRTESFNLVVASCINCHQRVCPGPIAAIEQNFISLKK